MKPRPTHLTILALGITLLVACDSVVPIGSDDLTQVADVGGGSAPSEAGASQVGLVGGEAGVPGGGAGSGAGAAQGGSGGVRQPGPIPGVGTELFSSIMDHADYSDWTQGNNGQRLTLGNATATQQAGIGVKDCGTVCLLNAGTGLEAAILSCRVPATSAWYSAYYRIPKQPITSRWTLMRFADSMSDRYEVVLSTGVDGKLHPSLAVSGGAILAGPAPTPVPIDSYFELKALYDCTTGSGRLALWLDGALLLDVVLGDARADNYVIWSIGSISGDISPVPVELRLDNALVSATQ